jgi:hypothetical protein
MAVCKTEPGKDRKNRASCNSAPASLSRKPLSPSSSLSIHKRPMVRLPGGGGDGGGGDGVAAGQGVAAGRAGTRRGPSVLSPSSRRLGIGAHWGARRGRLPDWPRHCITESFNLRLCPPRRLCASKGSVAWLAERQSSSGVTWVRSLPAAPSRCGSGPSGPEPSGWLINQLGNPGFASKSMHEPNQAPPTPLLA